MEVFQDRWQLTLMEEPGTPLSSVMNTEGKLAQVHQRRRLHDQPMQLVCESLIGNAPFVPTTSRKENSSTDTQGFIMLICLLVELWTVEEPSVHLEVWQNIARSIVIWYRRNLEPRFCIQRASYLSHYTYARRWISSKAKAMCLA